MSPRRHDVPTPYRTQAEIAQIDRAITAEQLARIRRAAPRSEEQRVADDAFMVQVLRDGERRPWGKAVGGRTSPRALAAETHARERERGGREP